MHANVNVKFKIIYGCVNYDLIMVLEVICSIILFKIQ